MVLNLQNLTIIKFRYFKIAVIIPTKNSQAHLTNCLESVRCCRRRIIIDSESTDETISMVDDMEQK